MLHTKNDLPEKVRKSVIPMLQERLSLAIDLMLQAKHAHWNISGPNFIALHQLFDLIGADITEHVDLLAERIVQLGGIAQGTLQATAQSSSLPWYPIAFLDSHEHLEGFSRAIAVFAETVRQGIKSAADWEDAGTADILTQISRSTDKNLWFVESHLDVKKAMERPAKGAA